MGLRPTYRAPLHNSIGQMSVRLTTVITFDVNSASESPGQSVIYIELVGSPHLVLKDALKKCY